MKQIMKHKKAIIILLVVLLAAGAGGYYFIHNQEKENQDNLNDSYSTSSMIDMNGNTHSFEKDEDGILNDSSGIGVAYSDTMKKYIESGNLFPGDLESSGYIFVYQPTVSGSSEESTDEVVQLSEDNAFYYMAVYRLPKEATSESQSYEQMFKEQYSHIEQIGETEDNIYYIAYNTDISQLNFSDEDKANIQELIEEIKNYKDYVCLYRLENSEEKTVGEFSAVSAQGDTVTQDVFSKYDITMVNIWSTTCEPCKEEMPELQELYEKLPDNVNFISICMDGADDTDLTQKILETYKSKFTVLYPDSALKKLVQDNYSAVPTTIFVDKNGNIVGDPMVGAPSGDVVQTYLDAIQERLDQLNSDAE